MYDGFIYETTCLVNGMKYRGRHTRKDDPIDRDDRDYLGSPTNPQFWGDLERYGRENFVREIIDEGPFEDRLSWMKQETRRLKEVDAANNPLYYNRSNWGGTEDQSGENNPNYGKTWHLSEETKKKIAESMRGKTWKQKSAHRRARTMSEDTKKKISEALKGNTNTKGKTWIISAEGKLNRSAAQKGHSVSEDTKKKISEALKGNTNSLGFKHTEDTRKKMSESHIGLLKGENHYLYGKKMSEETKKKLSESHKNKRYLLICKNCHQEFLGKSGAQKLCSICKDS